ncbi:uncharacterized protein [Excalfactoria chinensis]|uniref:uncharacterized protein n=1 Tax=Excalfactoria chinensis TaxID=46218 RepID=UPI003B3B4725
MQDSTLAYVKPHPVSYCPALQSVQVSLNGRTAFRRVSQSSQLRVISKLAEGGHYPLIKVIDEDVEQNWTQHRPLGDTTSHRPPARHRTANDNPLHSASQPILDPLHRPLIYPILPQLCYKDVMGDRIKSLTEIKVDYIYRSPPVHPASDIFIKGHQLSGDGIQHKLFHHLPWDRGEADWPIITRVILLALFEDWGDIGHPPVFRHLPSSPRPLKNYRERLSNNLRQLSQHPRSSSRKMTSITLPPSTNCHPSITEGHQSGQARSAVGEATLAVSHHLFFSRKRNGLKPRCLYLAISRCCSGRGGSEAANLGSQGLHQV